MPFKIITRYDYSALPNPVVMFSDDDPESRSMTNQSDKDSTDINLIMKRYEKTGLIPDLLTGRGRLPHFGDFTGVGDYHQLQNTIAKTSQAFAALPASTRNRFQNDPAQLIEFISDEKNLAEAATLGLAPKTPADSEASPPAAGDPPAPATVKKVSPAPKGKGTEGEGV